jgi:hypothetical protein
VERWLRMMLDCDYYYDEMILILALIMNSSIGVVESRDEERRKLRELANR